MADALTGKTETSATIEEIVSATVQDVLTAEMVVPPTITDMSSQVSEGMDKLKCPRFGNFSVDTKAENTPVDAQVNAFATDDMLLDKHQVVQFLIEDIAELQSKVAVQNHYVEQAAKDLAAKLDLDVIDSMEAGASAAAPDHRIAYAGASLAKTDILEAKKLLGIAKVPQGSRTLLISPASEKALLDITEFVRVNESGSAEGLRNGQIGRLFGFDVVVSPQVEDLKTLAYHSTCQAFARQMAPKTEMDRDLANLADRWSISHLWGTKTLDSGKRMVLLGTAV